MGTSGGMHMTLKNLPILSVTVPDQLHFTHLFSWFLDEHSDQDL
jgi:hypothetical protein